MLATAALAGCASAPPADRPAVSRIGPIAEADLTSVALATFKIEQRPREARSTVGTGLLIAVQRSGQPEPAYLLVTAHHVLERMNGDPATISWRTPRGSGFGLNVSPLSVRHPDGRPRWTRHRLHDIAALPVAPPEAARAAALPLSALATREARYWPGQRLYALGYPRGLSANPQGLPVSREGIMASLPAGPGDSDTFIIDVSVYSGNSGGPVVVFEAGQPRIAGLLLQQVSVDDVPLDLGVAIYAHLVADTIRLALDEPQS
jgi:S1-C subfamily serine protease